MSRCTVVDPRFGARMRQLRERRGLSLRDLERPTLTSKSTLHKIETGVGRPTPETVRLIDDALHAGGELIAMVHPHQPVPAGEGGRQHRSAQDAVDDRPPRPALAVATAEPADERDPRAPADPGGLGDGARRFARGLRLQLMREHLDLPDLADAALLDPDSAAAAVRDSAATLETWHCSRRRGPRWRNGRASPASCTTSWRTTCRSSRSRQRRRR